MFDLVVTTLEKDKTSKRKKRDEIRVVVRAGHVFSHAFNVYMHGIMRVTKRDDVVDGTDGRVHLKKKIEEAFDMSLRPSSSKMQ